MGADRYQANMALAVSCFTLGDVRMRPRYLRVASDILAKWHEVDGSRLFSIQLGSMYLSCGTALLQYVRSGSCSDKSNLISEAILCANHAHSQFEVCCGENSLAVKQVDCLLGTLNRLAL